MTIISGKIESLKKLKEALHSRGIYRFNSVGAINSFLKSYESEKKNIRTTVEQVINEEIKYLKESSEGLIAKRDKHVINKFLYFSKAREQKRKYADLVNNYEQVISQRISESHHNLKYIKDTLNELYTTIAGAVGENAVVNELKKLPDDFYLINDFSLNFTPPIYNKLEEDRIHSIQIDHLLISQSGIYILETKNWSRKSIEQEDIRSPVEQVKRASYALFVFLNSSKSESLVQNNWGVKKIPIKNVIVMTNKTLGSDFQHVKVLPLNQLIGYVDFFEPVLDAHEVRHVFNYLNLKVRQSSK